MTGESGRRSLALPHAKDRPPWSEVRYWLGGTRRNLVRSAFTTASAKSRSKLPRARPGPSVDPGDAVASAARRLAQQETRAIPIVCGSALVGMLDATDVARARPSAAPTLTIGEIEGRLSRVAVRQIVSAGVTAVGPRTPLTEAIRLMRA